LKKENKDGFKRQFSKWEKCLTAAKVKNMEELYTKVHAGIRAKPTFTKKAPAKNPTRKITQKGPKQITQDSKGRKWLRCIKGDVAKKMAIRKQIMEKIRKQFGVNH